MNIKRFECHTCQVTFSDERSLKLHFNTSRTHKVNKPPADRLRESVEVINVEESPKLSKDYPIMSTDSASKSLERQERRNEKRSECHTCQVTFSDERSLKIHTKRAHKVNKLPEDALRESVEVINVEDTPEEKEDYPVMSADTASSIATFLERQRLRNMAGMDCLRKMQAEQALLNSQRKMDKSSDITEDIPEAVDNEGLALNEPTASKFPWIQPDVIEQDLNLKGNRRGAIPDSTTTEDQDILQHVCGECGQSASTRELLLLHSRAEIE